MSHRARAVPLVALLVFVTVAPALVTWAVGPGRPSPARGEEVRTVVLDIRFSRFSVPEIDVRPGETVRVVVRNHDPIPHELIIGDLAVQDRHETGTEAHHGTVPGEVSVAHNGEAETTYTFPVTADRPILFGCHLPGHWDYGMQGTVRIT